MNKKYSIMFLFLLCFPAISMANIQSSLDNIFNNMSVYANTTAPRAYQGQQAGYYSGGSLYARTAVSNVQLVEVDVPTFSAGCGGIDLYMGGFSFVNKQAINNMSREIMNSAGAYAFKLALAEVTPLIKNVMTEVQDIADKANKMNINSCETAEELVGGVWPKTQAAQQQVCRDVGSSKSLFSDWTEARQGCTTSAEKYNYEDTMKTGKGEDQYKNMILDDGNIVWNALKENSLVGNDPELAEFLMSLSGSIIISNSVDKNGQKSNKITNLESLSKDHDLFQSILYGNTSGKAGGEKAKIYKCDESDKCLNPSIVEINISPDSSLSAHVRNLLISISNKIISDEKLTDEEMGLIQSTRIPIYKILNVQAAYEKDPDILDVDSYSDVIATDILFQYLQENLEIVKVSSGFLQYPDDIMNKFIDGINMAMSDVREEQKITQTKISMAMQLIEQSQVLEQMLAGQLSAKVGNSMNWAKSLN